MSHRFNILAGEYDLLLCVHCGRVYGDDGSEDMPENEQLSVGSSGHHEGGAMVESPVEQNGLREGVREGKRPPKQQAGASQDEGTMVGRASQQRGPHQDGGSMVEGQSLRFQEAKGAMVESGGAVPGQSQHLDAREERAEMVVSPTHREGPENSGKGPYAGDSAPPDHTATAEGDLGRGGALGTAHKGLDGSAAHKSSVSRGGGAGPKEVGQADGSTEVLRDLGRRGGGGKGGSNSALATEAGRDWAAAGSRPGSRRAGGAVKPTEGGADAGEAEGGTPASAVVSSSSGDSPAGGGSMRVVLVWACCVMGVACVACFLLRSPQRRGPGAAEVGAGRFGPLLAAKAGGGDGGSGGGGGVASPYSTSSGGLVGSCNGSAARMRNGSGGLPRGVGQASPHRLIEGRNLWGESRV